MQTGVWINVPNYVITLLRISHGKNQKMLSTVIWTLALPTLLITEMNYMGGTVEQRMSMFFIIHHWGSGSLNLDVFFVTYTQKKFHNNSSWWARWRSWKSRINTFLKFVRNVEGLYIRPESPHLNLRTLRSETPSRVPGRMRHFLGLLTPVFTQECQFRSGIHCCNEFPSWLDLPPSCLYHGKILAAQGPDYSLSGRN